jgi:hypothetical protein
MMQRLKQTAHGQCRQGKKSQFDINRWVFSYQVRVVENGGDLMVCGHL